MADVNANIGVNIDTSQALAQLKTLQRQISQFHTSISRSSETAALSQKSLQKNFLNSVNSIGAFSAELRTVKSTTESFTSSLEGNKFSMREYFRYAGGATKTFGRLFASEFDTIGKVAEDRVKRMQTQYIKMGRDANGAMQAISIMPTALDMESYGTKTAIAAQKQALFNQLMKQGSTNLLNFGKNTQWAGRQLMVGFTIPLAMVGSAATKTFMEMETQAIKFKKVYGDLFTPKEETQQALDNIVELGKSFTQYGIAVSTTVGLAAEAAAAGFSGLDLQRQTTEATRLSILGQLESQKALETTISLQNSFGMSSESLADSINFLNAVENQTVVSLDDITTAIPKVAPVIQQLGGDVKDLTFFIAAMKEGGINASEGANALKSGLAALINPTGRASDMLKGFGINANEIVTKNKGNLKATVIEFASALNELDPLNRAQAIEQMFGKFQFARLSTLFANVAKDGNQAARVLTLANSSVEELSALSEQELGMTAESSMNKFKKTVEDLKFSLVPVGKAFLEAVTPIVEFVAGILEKFGNLSEGTKKAITIMTVAVGGIGPILLMAFGLLANGVANIIKLFLTLRNGYLRLTGQSQVLGEQTNYLTMEQIDAAAASHSLNQAHATLTQQFTAESAAVTQLIAAYQGATKAGAAFAMANPGSMVPRRKSYNNGVVSVPGNGNKDTVPAMLTPGEAVIPAEMAKKYGPLINGMIANNIPGYNDGKETKGVSPGKKVIIPGGMDVSHFGPKIKMSGADLTKLFENADKKVKDRIKKLVDKFADTPDRMFTLYNNQVVAQLADVNRDMGKKGKASMDRVKENIIGKDFAPLRDIELKRQFDLAGKSTKEFLLANRQLTEAMTEGFDLLGDNVEITSDQLDELIETAYKKVGAINPAVAEANVKMSQIGAVTEPDVDGRRGKRIPILASSYLNQKAPSKNVYKKGMSELSGGEDNVPYNLNSEFFISPSAMKKLNLTGDQAEAIFKNLSIEVQKSLAKVRADTDEFVNQWKSAVSKAEAAGVNLGASVVNNVAKGAGTKSPSKKTMETGEDIGKGLEIGMQSRKDEIAAVATDLGNTATGKIRRVSQRAQGAPPSSAPKQTGRRASFRPEGDAQGVSARAVREAAALAEAQKKAAEATSANAIVTNKSRMSLSGLDRNLMGASFAVSSLSGIASMSGGKLGSMAGVISKVTGAMFALQAITGLLTQTKALELIQTRAGLAKSAVANAMAAGPMFGGASKAASGKAGILGSLARVGLGLKTFLGPVGLATTAAGLLYMGFKKYQSTQEKARLAIEGLGDAALLSSGKIGTLEDFFGVKATKSNLERTGPQLTLNKEERSQVDELRGREDFQKEFKTDIGVLRDATNAEAKLVFQSLAMQLSSKGFAKENIDIIIKSLQEESGKTKVKIDFGNIDLTTEKGRKGVVKTAKNLGKVLDAELKRATSKESLKSVKYADQSFAGITKRSAELSKTVATTSKVFSAFFNSLSGEFSNGTITGKEFNQSFLELSGTIENMPDGQGLAVMNAVLETMDSDLAKAALGTTNLSDKMLLLQAASLGVATITPAMIKSLNSLSSLSGPDAAKEKNSITNFIESEIKKITDFKDLVNKAVGSTTKPFKDMGDGTGKGDSLSDKYLKVLNKEIDALERKRDAQKNSNDELQREMDLEMKQSDLANQATLAKISGDFIGAANLQQESINVQDQFNQETEMRKKDAEIEALKARAQAIESGAKLTKPEIKKIPKKAMGGIIKKYSVGGLISGPGSGTSDSITASLGYAGGGALRVSNGEFIVKASSVRDYGINSMNAINSGTATIGTNSGSTVYNINMPITSNQSDPKAVGDYVIKQLKLVVDKNNKANAVMY